MKPLAGPFKNLRMRRVFREQLEFYLYKAGEGLRNQRKKSREDILELIDNYFE